MREKKARGQCSFCGTVYVTEARPNLRQTCACGGTIAWIMPPEETAPQMTGDAVPEVKK
jgi:hypothetical protein